MAQRLRIPPKQNSIFDRLDERRAIKPEVHVHDWEKQTEHIRRSLTPEEEHKLYQYNQMFPGNDGNQPLSASLTHRTCKGCDTRQLIDYKVN